MYQETFYPAEDYNKLKTMPLREVIEILEGLEGNYIPPRPVEYYYDSLLTELEFDNLRNALAIDIAVNQLKKLEEKDNG